MRLSFQSLLLTGSALFPFALANDCREGPFGQSLGPSGKTWDKEGGGEFCSTKWKQGHVITGIEIWSLKWHVKAIQVAFSDGSKGPIHGDPNGEYEHGSITWGADDKIQKLNQMSNYWGNGDAAGRIIMEVAGQKFNVGSDTGSYQGTSVLTHSGTLLAVHGKNGNFLDTLEFKFMAQGASKAEIVELRFPESLDDWNEQRKGITDITLAEVYIKNSNKKGIKTYTFSQSMDKQTSKTISQQNSHTFGVKVGVKVGGGVQVPFFAEATAEINTETSYQYANTNTASTTDTGTIGTNWGEAGELEPGRAAHCKAHAFTGKYTGSYVSVIKVTMADGQEFNIEQPGNFESIGWTRAISDCKNISLKEIPSSAEIVEADNEEAGSENKKRAVGFVA